MARPDKTTVRDALTPYHDRIRSVVERAWREWRLTDDFRRKSGMGPVMYSRTVANYVFDAIARIAVAEFGGDETVHVRFDAQTIRFYFRGGVYARFKKGDDSNLGQAIPTQAALAFEDMNATLPGLPPETAKIEIIWQANDIGTNLEHVLVVARDGDRVLWQYEIEDSASKTGTIITLVPQPPQPTAPQGDKPLVKPKAGKTKKSDDK